jgi:hypothetical protein
MRDIVNEFTEHERQFILFHVLIKSRLTLPHVEYLC